MVQYAYVRKRGARPERIWIREFDVVSGQQLHLVSDVIVDPAAYQFSPNFKRYSASGQVSFPYYEVK